MMLFTKRCINNIRIMTAGLPRARQHGTGAVFDLAGVEDGTLDACMKFSRLSPTAKRTTEESHGTGCEWQSGGSMPPITSSAAYVWLPVRLYSSISSKELSFAWIQLPMLSNALSYFLLYFHGSNLLALPQRPRSNPQINPAPSSTAHLLNNAPYQSPPPSSSP